MNSTVIETSSDHDLLEIDGVPLDEFLEFLNSSPPRENAHNEVSAIIPICISNTCLINVCDDLY